MADGIVVYQGRSKKGAKNFFNPNGHSWGTTLPETAEMFAGKSDTHYPKANPPRTETEYHGEVHKLRFKINNPLKTNIRETLWNPEKESDKIAEAKEKGHDGLEIYHSPEKTDYVAFHPDQVEHIESYTPPKTIAKADGGGITAYHGSPHEFDEFDTSKIGTGEGAQAYGHGLYFAESEPVAKGYRDSSTDIRLKPKKITNPELLDQIKKNEEQSSNLFDQLQLAKTKEEEDKILNEINRLDDANKQIYGMKGHMYEVHIDAHPDHFLDWDKSLSEQSEHIQNFARSIPTPKDQMGSTSAFNSWKNGKGDLGYPVTGSLLHNIMTNNGLDPDLQKKASELMLSHGIQGIKYLDYDSRLKGKGSRNYVVFDQNRVKVKRRYAEGGEIEMPHSLKELQDWPKTHHNKPDIDAIFTSKESGFEGAPQISMPSNLQELEAYSQKRASGGKVDEFPVKNKDKGDTEEMTPQEYLRETPRLKMDKDDSKSIDKFKKKIEKGKKIGAPKLLPNHEADGRHRATAAMELGIKKIPVVNYRKRDGGAIVDRALMLISKKA